MAQLQDEIKALLHVPEASHLNLEKESFFIPQDSLYQLLNEDKVTQVIDEIDEIPWHLKETTTVWIMKNGRRILAILSFLQLKRSYISKFMERDVFDEHLPLNENSLQAILPEPANSLFYDAQWQFSAPKLARDGVHRVFHPNHRLPFTINRWIDSGGFGDIYEIMIHPKHQNVPLLLSETDQSMVRKEFKPPRYKKHVANSDIQDDKEGFSNELRNLNILNELKHANIIQLLTSYTHNGRHNLIFPFVQDGNLEKLFKGDRPLQFDSDEKFLIALCGLSSAIQEVHYYTLQRLKIDLLGCHHDLKTKNILVRGNNFILADFGLSKLKEAQDSTESLYAGGAGDYLAPECEDFNDGFERHSVNQSSDIWSFGCIIAEVLTYMRGGTNDVQHFRSLRRIKIGYSMMASFHGGIETPNDGALKWISNLQRDSDTFSKPLVQLILSMLDLSPENRPDARFITFKLRYITASAYASQVGSLFDELVSKLSNSFDAYSECIKFKTWKSAFNKIEAGNEWDGRLNGQMEMTLTIQILQKLLQELKSTISRCETQLSPLFTNLKRRGDELERLLPEKLRRQAKAQWEIEVMSAEKLDSLEEIEKVFEDSLSNSRISKLARIKRMSYITSQKCDDNGSRLRVDPKFVKLVGSCGNHTLALLGSEDNQSKTQVVIEWIRYSNRESEIFPKLFSRIKALAYLLHDFPGPENFRTLSCSAFIHDPRESAFGLLYAYPHQDTTAPKSLANILKETADSRERPTLESRFRLALSLAVSISSFHNVGWLHKSISPYNIFFFISKGSQPTGWLKEPYLTGFNHSRQDDPLAFTVGPATDASERRYHHPDYIQMGGYQLSFTPKFDYYSFGLVLLEIGLWQTLEDIVPRKLHMDDSKAVLSYVLTKRVPILGHYMGTAYQNVVARCLDGFGSPVAGGFEFMKEDRQEFERSVVEPLRGCCIH